MSRCRGDPAPSGSRGFLLCFDPVSQSPGCSAALSASQAANPVAFAGVRDRPPLEGGAGMLPKVQAAIKDK
jgi:hypothetical protein